MADTTDMGNDNSDNIDFDFDGELIDLEDISEEKNISFDDISEDDMIVDFEDIGNDSLSSADLVKEIEVDDLADISNLPDKNNDNFVKDSAIDNNHTAKLQGDTLAEDDDIIELVDLARGSSDGVGEDDNIIELVNVVAESRDVTTERDVITEEEEAVIDLVNIVEDNVSEDRLGDRPGFIESDQSGSETKGLPEKSPSEDQIEALIEKVIEKRYAEKIDTLFSQVIGNVLNRQMDDIKKKILNALKDVDLA